MKISSGKTKVVMLNDASDECSMLKEGDECYIEGFHPTVVPPCAIVVRLSDGIFDFAYLHEIKAIAINDN